MKKYFKKNRWQIIGMTISNLIYVLAIGGMPFITKQLFDYDFSGQLSGIIWIILSYVLVVGIGMLSQYYTQIFGWQIERNFKLDMKHDLFQAMTYYPYQTFAKQPVNDYVSTLENDVDVVVKQYTMPILDMIQQAIQVIVYAIYLVFLDYRIALVILLGSALTVKIPDLTATEFSNRKQAHQRGIGKYMSLSNNLLTGFKAINHQTRDAIIHQHDETLNETEHLLYRFGTFKAFTLVLSGTAMYLVNIIGYATLGFLFVAKQITKGQGAAALQYISDFGYPFSYLLECYGSMCATRGVKERLLDTIHSHTSDEGEVYPSLQSKIEFNNVSVTYENFTLDSLNLTFEKGKKYALIGHSGSGKSTILNTLMQYVSLTEGQILIDGIPLQQLQSNSLMMCLNQAEPLFIGSFLENVSLFDSYDASPLTSWITVANCSRLNQLKTKTSCEALSGGEGQLVHLMKSLLSDKDALLLDESFSALDPDTKAKMYELMYGLEDKLVIAVTHDTSSEHLSRFDEVLLFDCGRVVAKGRYDDLKLEGAL